MKTLASALFLLSITCINARAQEGAFTTKSLTPETALIAAKAAMETCRKTGYQTSVAVVDRSGLMQAFVRDRYATAHTVDFAQNKAWSAASFKIPTASLANETQAGKPMSGIRSQPRVAAFGGGLPIEAGGTLFGGIGVSGAPGGEEDDVCAKAGIAAIKDSIEF
jgi:uncharacterized protein GlcG (DUF336 family)